MDQNNQWFVDFYEQVKDIRRLLSWIAFGISLLVGLGILIAFKLLG